MLKSLIKLEKLVKSILKRLQCLVLGKEPVITAIYLTPDLYSRVSTLPNFTVNVVTKALK